MSDFTLFSNTEKTANRIDLIVNELVANYCSPLDNYMLQIKQLLDDTANPPTDEELENMAMRLPNLLYFTGEAVESLGIREDVAKSIKLEIYNNIHQQTQGTIADKNSVAENASKEEALVHMCYQRSYKKIKLRMEAGYEMLASVKKVLSRRMLELQLTYESHGNKCYGE